MKLKIRILLTEIDADGPLCAGQCVFLHIGHMDMCLLFGAFLDLDMPAGRLKRCAECMGAEKETKQ